MVQAEVREAVKQGAGLIELRLDFLRHAPDFKRLLADKACPIIATVRRPEDGGKWVGGEDARRMLLRQCIVGGFDWVDLETDVADHVPRFKDVRRIVSYHNLREVPADLEQIHEHMCKQDADVVKVAVRAQKPADNLRVLDLLRKSAKPTVALCMGDLGTPARLLAARYGAPFTYAAFNKERGIAPGMPSFAELKKVYRYDRINADTAVYGVVGDPVGHSLSPLIHNHFFRAAGLNAVYLPFRVPRGDLGAVLEQFDHLPVHGYSVTIPHKEAAAALAKHPDGAVARTRAANTLLRVEDGFAAFNTDYQGILDSLRAHYGAEGPRSRAALVLGAGGVARAAAFALLAEGAAVTIAGRTFERAHKLAEEVGCKCVDWAARHQGLHDLVINCTPVGMHPNVDETPLHHSTLKPGLTVFDTVYTPETTLLVKEAQSRGCTVITGVELFVRQAALQFQHFAGKEAPLDEMRKMVRRALSPVAVRDEE
jgi:3-dehydroquinate dehydratase/shikimate dehydrogenase